MIVTASSLMPSRMFASGYPPRIIAPRALFVIDRYRGVNRRGQGNATIRRGVLGVESRL